MAKGLRAKSKRTARILKREGLFGDVENKRLERLAAAQAEAANGADYVPVHRSRPLDAETEALSSEETMVVDHPLNTIAEESMEVDDVKETKKISATQQKKNDKMRKQKKYRSRSNLRQFGTQKKGNKRK